MGEFEGKVVWITGGGSGIGAAAARLFAQGGARVVLLGRRREPLEQIARDCRGLVLQADAADPQAVRGALAQVRSECGGVDILLANAGGHGVARLADTDDASWALAKRLNLDTAFVCARELMPDLVARKGNVVIVSSIAGQFAGPDAVGYVTTKHALIGLTRSLARDHGRYGVRVNAVSPGWVRTEMADVQMRDLMSRDGMENVEAAYARVTRDVPLGRAAQPGEVAEAIACLASPRASMISGISLLVDGGASAVDLPTLAFATV